MKYYLALDIGTTNWKALIFDENGKLVDSEKTPTVTHRNENDYAFYNPEEIRETIFRMIKELISRNSADIAALSIASVGEAVVPIGRNGKVLDDVIAWFDTRSYAEAEMIRRDFGAEKLFSITGLDINPIFALPKILWIKKNRPQVFENVYKWLQISDFMVFSFTGEYYTDYSLASRTQAFDISKNEWSKEIIDYYELDMNTFPTIVDAGTCIGHIRSNIASELGLKETVKVVIGGHDHPCASVITGATRGGKILDSSGTAEAYLYISEKNQNPLMEFKGQRTVRYLQKDRYISIGGIVSSGASFEWAYRMLTNPEAFGLTTSESKYSDILNQVKDVKAFEQGLMCYPHLRGVGAPYWDSRMSGSFLGIRDYMDGRHFLRSIMEGLSMQTHMIIDMHETIAGTKIDTLYVVGGGSKNIVWQQIKADITGKNIELCHEPEATALGAAMLAAKGDDLFSSIEEISEKLNIKNDVLQPDPVRHDIYEDFYSIYLESYEAIKEVNIKLNAIENNKES